MKKCPACGGDLKLKDDGTYVCLWCGNEVSVEEPQKQSSTPSSEGTGVFDKNISSILEIVWSDGKYISSGSGCIISSDGYAITNTHVVTSDDGNVPPSIKAKVNGVTYNVRVEALGDDKHGHGSGIDLALIKLETRNGLIPVTFADFNLVKTGQKVYVIGNSLGQGTCITSGIVSDRLRRVGNDYLLMTDCPINGGNSGGPMFDENGEVIGIVVSGITGAEGMNFAIPSKDVVDFIDKSKNKYRNLF